ncbi:unnamed protein product [Mytilus coruscus]|uniref:SWIM-type domain-containing protein n=1 Tax=Mytilus coruscus TaxID=42192 RepID=A0A6J8BS85_MYTCO|nr:unnamed protein product [Mytilus coruscus]
MGENIKVTESGRTFFNIRETDFKRQELVAQKARRNITEMFEGPSTSIQSDRQASRSEFVINEDCSFEPTVKKQKMSIENQRPFPFRPRRNAQVNKSILFAKSANLKLLEYKKTNDIIFSFQNYKEERTEVSLQQVPNCSCPFKTKNPSKICMHIVFALLRYFDVDEISMLLHQLAYTNSEVNKLKNSLVEIRTNNESLEQSWILSRKEKLPGKIPNCSGCKTKSILPGDLHICVKRKNSIEKQYPERCYIQILSRFEMLEKYSDLEQLKAIHLCLCGLKRKNIRKRHFKNIFRRHQNPNQICVSNNLKFCL